MATLTGQQIDASYLGLLKTEDNGIIGNVAKGITDGQGGVTNMTVGTTSTNFVSGTVDFTGATVSGIPGALRAGSLNSDNFPNNLRNIATPGGSPVTSNAYGWQSLSLGDTSFSNGSYSIAMGLGSVAGSVASTLTGGQVALGWGNQAIGQASVAIGGLTNRPSKNNGQDCISIGANTNGNTADYVVAIGSDINITGNNSVGIGNGNDVFAANSICIGTNVNDSDAARVKAISMGNDLSTAQRTVNIGNSQNAFGADGVCIGGSNAFGGNFNVAVGYNNDVSGGGENVVAIGANSTASVNGSVALGVSVTASKVNTVSVTELETKLIGGGITMVSPDGTEYKLTVANGGTLVIT